MAGRRPVVVSQQALTWKIFSCGAFSIAMAALIIALRSGHGVRDAFRNPGQRLSEKEIRDVALFVDKRSELCQIHRVRSFRILGQGPCSFYHVLSRVIERRFILGEQEQEHFRKLMRAQEAF